MKHTFRAATGKIAGFFVQGLLVLVPLGITVWLLINVFTRLDKPITDWFLTKTGYNIPGLGILLITSGIIAIGYLAQNFVTKGLISLVDQVFTRLPLVKLVYNSLKDMMDAFFGEKKRFDRPVWVTVIPDSDVRVAGFMTRETVGPFGLPDHVAIYVPQSYNFAAQVLIVPKSQVTPIDADSADVMTFIVSGGVSGQGEGLKEGGIPAALGGGKKESGNKPGP